MLIFLKKKTACRVQGFTLVELLVSTSVFVVVLTIAVDSLFAAQLVNTHLQKTQIILDGVNLATEVIVRDIRYGSEFNCTTLGPSPTMLRQRCPYGAGMSPGTALVFKPAVPLQGTLNGRYDRVAYYLQGNAIYKKEYPYGSSVRTYQITSSDVTITTLGFYSVGVNSTTGASDVSSQSDPDQPLVVVMMSGKTKTQTSQGGSVSFKLHTSATARVIDR